MNRPRGRRFRGADTKRWPLAILLALGAAAPPAWGQGGLGLRWDGCAADPGSRHEKRFACDSNVGGSFVLFASVVAPANMPRFAAASATIDVVVSRDFPLPPWWQVAPGQCRAGAIAMLFDPAMLETNCPDLWQGGQRMSAVQIQPGRIGAGTVRLYGGAALEAGHEVEVLADGTELNVCRVHISRSRSSGTEACDGCPTCAFINFSECRLLQPAGLGDYTVTFPSGPGGSFVYWNGVCDPYVPTTRRTWGAIKGMYR